MAAMASGVLFMVGPAVFNVGHSFLYYLGYPVIDHLVLYVLFGLSSVAALLLAPLGMVGFHVLQRHSYGCKGHAGFWLVVIGSLVTAVGGMIFFTLGESGDFLQATPPLVWVAFGLVGLTVGVVSLLVGFVLYGVATLQAKELPRWCGAAFSVALPIALALSVPFLFYVAFGGFGLVWLALGYTLWRRR